MTDLDEMVARYAEMDVRLGDLEAQEVELAGQISPLQAKLERVRWEMSALEEQMKEHLAGKIGITLLNRYWGEHERSDADRG